jgi:DNA-binding NtrC family response regulator
MSHHVELPPLRDRTEDLRLLIETFAAETTQSLGRDPVKLPSGVESIFVGYPFPGNVRELQAIVYDVISRVPGTEIARDDFRRHPALQDQGPDEDLQGRFSYSGPIPKLSEVEDYLFREAMEKAGGNQSAAARMLGVSQSTLSRWAARQ